MNCTLPRTLLVPAVLVSTVVFGRTTDLMAQQLAPPGQPLQQVESVEQQGVETLTRGPIHEAFAEVVSYNPQPGITVPNQPPEPINELPPEQRPDNENTIWIPGYWSWSEDQNDFIWISGVWRVPAPGSQWVPGYWDQVQNGYQWISGYWWYGDEQGQEEQVTYLPVPPDSLEKGPNSPQPADDQFWVPGVWIWQETQYVWRPGYWAQIRPNWVWVPDRYMWTPSGCVFIAGHWDYTMPRRGLCFSPVLLQPAVYTRPDFRYVPVVLIDVYVVHYHLFCRPAYNHYYFGDYYDPRYREIGIRPWFDLYRGGVAYEPFYIYNRWYFRHHEPQRDWSQRIRRWYDYRVRHPDARPPHTYRAMQDLLRRDGTRQPELLEVALSFDRAKKRQEFPIKLVPVDQQYRDRMIDLRRQVQDFSRERVQREKQLKQRFAEGKPDKPQRIKFPTPPVRGERVGLAERPERPGQRERQEGRLPEVPGKPGAKEKPDVPSFPAPELPEPPADTPEAGKPEAPGKPDRRGKPDMEAPGRAEGPEKPEAGKPEAPGKPDRRGKPDREAPGRADGPEKPERRAPGKPEAPDMERERGKTPPTERERPERRRPQERDFPGFGGEQPERRQPERRPETDRQRQEPQRGQDRRGPQDRFERPGGDTPQRSQRFQQPDRPQSRQQDQPGTGFPGQPQGQRQRDLFDRPGGDTPQRPQRFQQPDRPQSRQQEQPGTGFPGQPQGQRQRDRFERPDSGDLGRQPQDFRRGESRSSDQRQGFPQRQLGTPDQSERAQRRAFRPQEQEQGFGGQGADRQRPDMFQRSRQADQPRGFQGPRDAGSGRETPSFGGGRSGGDRDAQFRGPSDRGGRSEARSFDRGGDGDRERRRGRDER